MFKLAPKFLATYEGQQPAWGFGVLSYITFKRTYARTKCPQCNVCDPHYYAEDISKDINPCRACKVDVIPTQEEYYDVCKRVTEGVFEIQRRHCEVNKLPWNNARAQKTAQEFYRRMWEFKWTPPGRGMWIVGTPVMERCLGAAVMNCGFRSSKDISIELAEPFAWAMDMLMLGVGIGFDTLGHEKVVIKKPTKTPVIFVIPDSREGWVESQRLLINSYHGGGNVVEFDYSKIRKRGLPIRGFGGTASGPEPLIELHKSTRALLDSFDGLPITDVGITDLMDFEAKCVVAGNIRRSALLSKGKLSSKEFITMKDPVKFGPELQDRRWAANHTVDADPLDDFTFMAEHAGINGEPGLAFTANCHHYGRVKDGWIPFEDDRYDEGEGINPCSEQILLDGELCCLVETYPAKHDSAEDYKRTLKIAFLYGKTMTLLPTHNERTNAIMMRNRRIGCSMTGIQQAIKKFGRGVFFKDFCDEGYKVIRSWDRVYSKWLCVPRSIRLTTLKPSGTVSLLAGATPGIHWTHSEYYLRTVRIAANSPLIVPLYMAGYRIEVAFTDNAKLTGLSDIQLDNIYKIDDEAFGASPLSLINELGKRGVTLVVYFPVQEKNFTKSKFDVTLWEQLCLVREIQYYWSDNAVSCTVTVKDEEKSQLKDAIEYFAPYVKTLSFLPLTNHHYHQAPYIECTKDEYEKYSASLGPVHLIETSPISGEKFCSNDTCAI